MALIPPFFMNTVVALGGQSQDGTVQYNATGFLYGHPTGVTDENDAKTYRVFLVTNRHVFQRALERRNTLYVRFNKLMESGTNTYSIEMENDSSWTVHPDPDADVAVLSINVNRLKEDAIEYRWFSGDIHAVDT